MPDARQELGRSGETLAAEFLITKGLRLLRSNLRLKAGEIDLLMLDGPTIVVVEVKTKRVATHSDPVYQLTPAKQRKLWLLARHLAARNPERNVRIDAVTLYWRPDSPDPVITHYENIISS